MKDLIEMYKRKLGNTEESLWRWTKLAKRLTIYKNLETKASCYREFIKELEEKV